MVISNRIMRENAREYALRQIRENIISLRLKPGSTVSENELAKKLGMSRTPVREALQELQKSNLIEVYPQRGCVISHINFDVVEETVFLRKILEKAVVEELCETINEEKLAILEENIKLQEFYLDSRSADKIMELDNEFHRSLFVMCNKERIYNLMESMLSHFDRIRTLSLYSVKEIKIVSDHKAILNAISLKNKELAAEFIVKHLSRYKLDQDVIMEKYPEYFSVQ
ncbi:GntR family transcriptional regulator [Lachnospiraceae bacterium MD1]|uniref:GntR family transcriptional regulator n=1 Tax=Variimorphobacter saccharofermentans TaxID=2755051 RepID=A0A839K2S0_9FIRM|nr:GntR family transcriptional regulator [Variimorphobacter saccharofermentans]MBB2183920.1 GntR family transcriptional regulator [Variimorphobacter saccharofermentans]